jgi:hypothetical protein
MSEMTLKEYLTAARNRIADPDHWTRDAEARDASGQRVGATVPDAVKWCASGALLFVQPRLPEEYQAANGALIEAGYSLFNENYVKTNDRLRPTSHRDVLAIYDYAIEHAEEG